MKLTWTVGLIAAGAAIVAAQQGTAWPEADKLFRGDPQWMGSDAAFSIDLGNGRVLWLFNDTLVARKAGEGRRNAAFVRNTVGIETGYDPSRASMKFYWRPLKGKPEIFPSEGEIWMWPAAGVRVGKRLLVFCSRLAADRRPGTLGFKSAGWQAYAIDNPDDDVLSWKPRKVAEDHGAVNVGQGVLRDGEFVYITGTTEPPHDIYLARWKAADIEAGRFGPLEWWCGDGWRADPAGRQVVMKRVSTEASIQRDPRGPGYIEVNSQGFGATDIVMRRAEKIEGPWSAPVKIYRPPESDAKDAFVYAGKSHAELAGADLVITYATNGKDEEVHSGMSLYFPKFVRVNLGAER